MKDKYSQLSKDRVSSKAGYSKDMNFSEAVSERTHDGNVKDPKEKDLKDKGKDLKGNDLKKKGSKASKDSESFKDKDSKL